MGHFNKCEPAKVRQEDKFIKYYEIKGRDAEGNCEVAIETKSSNK